MSAIVERVRPAVVRITTDRATGSEVIFKTEGTTGYLVTNHHVIEDGSFITVTVNDRQTYSGSLLGSDGVRDLAVVKICCDNFQAVPFGNASTVEPGTQVLTLEPVSEVWGGVGYGSGVRLKRHQGRRY